MNASVWVRQSRRAMCASSCRMTARRRSTVHVSAIAGIRIDGRRMPNVIGIDCSRLRSKRTSRRTPMSRAHSASRRLHSGSLTSLARHAHRRTLERCTNNAITMTATPPTYTAPISAGQERLKRRAPAGGASASAVTDAGVPGLAADSFPRSMTGAASAAFGAVPIVKVQPGKAIDAIGSRSAPTRARLQIRWRVADDARRRKRAATQPAAPSSSETLITSNGAGDMAASRRVVLIARLPVRGRASAGCSNGGTPHPTAASR